MICFVYCASILNVQNDDNSLITYNFNNNFKNEDNVIKIKTNTIDPDTFLWNIIKNQKMSIFLIFAIHIIFVMINLLAVSELMDQIVNRLKNINYNEQNKENIDNAKLNQSHLLGEKEIYQKLIDQKQINVLEKSNIDKSKIKDKSEKIPNLIWKIIYWGLAVFFNTCLDNISDWACSTILRNNTQNASEYFFKRLLNNEAEFFLDKAPGDLLSKLNNVIYSLNDIFTYVFDKFISKITEIITYFVYLRVAPYIWGIYLIYCLLTIILFYYSNITNSKIYKEIHACNSLQNNAFLDGFSNILSRNIYGTAKKEIEIYKKLLEQENQLNKIAAYYSLIEYVLGAVLYFSFTIISLRTFVNNNKNKKFKSGIFNACYKLPDLTIKIFFALFSLSKSYKDFKNNFVIFSQQNTYIRGNHKLKYIHKIELKNIYKKYEKNNIINGINLVIKPGDKFIIKGKTGAGKTTLISMICGLILSTRGSVTFNNIDILGYKKQEILDKFVCVPQQCILYNDSIINNITIGLNSFSDENFKKACKLAAVDVFVINMKNGYYTIVGNGGSKLSGGERQRIFLARAFLRILEMKSQVAIFDEVTACLDEETAHLILQNIKNEFSQLILIFISHDRITELVFNSAITYILESGKIHLMKKNTSLYR